MIIFALLICDTNLASNLGKWKTLLDTQHSHNLSALLPSRSCAKYLTERFLTFSTLLKTLIAGSRKHEGQVLPNGSCPWALVLLRMLEGLALLANFCYSFLNISWKWLWKLFIQGYIKSSSALFFFFFFLRKLCFPWGTEVDINCVVIPECTVAYICDIIHDWPLDRQI